MERKILFIVIWFIIAVCLFLGGGLFETLVGSLNDYTGQADRWFYGAITLNTLVTAFFGFLIWKELAKLNKQR